MQTMTAATKDRRGILTGYCGHCRSPKCIHDVQRTAVRGPAGQPIGFVQQQHSGGWRGYSYAGSIGYGPFASQAGAEAFVREQTAKAARRAVR